MRAERALVVAVDMPLVQARLVSFLLSQAMGDALVVPIVEGVPQVLFALYPRSVLPLIEECLRQGRRDPRSLLEGAPVRYIEEEELRRVDPELRSFVNVNTPDELRKLT
jgi:molybdopterin-guanine dinucleotide biosynthesis protein A